MAIGLLLFFCASLASAKTLSLPEDAIQSVSESLKVILHDNQERLKTDRAYVYQLADEVVAPRVDFNKLSSLALGKYWRRASPEQKKEFMQQFQRLLVRTYATAFHEFGEWSLKFIPRQNVSDTGNVVVHSEVLRPGAPPVSVKYRMHKKDGEWFAYDVAIEGISLVTNYRTTFAKEVRRNGMDGLIKRITKLNNQRMAASQHVSR